MLKSLIPFQDKEKHQKQHRKTRSIETTDLIEHKSYKVISLVGYVIVGLTFFEYIHLLIPPHFLNPNWELQVIGQFVETVWILMLGLVMIFFRPKDKKVKKQELKTLAFFSWITLIFACICFLIAPLVISDTLRINQTAKERIDAQLANKESQMEQALSQVEVSREREIINLLKKNQAWNASSSADNAKTQLTNFLQEKNDVAIQELQQKLKNTQVKLFKTASKFFISAIVCGISFVEIWKHTTWTRNIHL